MYTKEEIVDIFLDNIRYLNVVHHVPGRIRVKASLSGARKLAQADQETLETIIAKIPGITNYRVNRKALSVIIEYNQQILPFKLWEQVGTLSENPKNRDNVRGQLIEILEG